MKRLSGEQQERLRYINASIEKTVDLLQRPEVAHYMGAYAVACFSQLIGRDLLPVTTESAPRELADDAQIPVLALRYGETARLPNTLTIPSEYQHALASQQAGQPLSRSDSRGVTTYRSPSERGSFSHVCTGLWKPRIDNHRILEENAVRGRPVMILGYKPGASRIDPSVLIHESIHVIQSMRDPFVSRERLKEWDFCYSRELEAYSEEAKFIDGLAASAYKTSPEDYGVTYSFDGKFINEQSNATNVDVLRARYNSPDNPYEANLDLAKRLAAESLPLISGSGPKIPA